MPCWKRRDNKRMPFAVVGMHRSGTSMVARLLNLAGIELGDPDAMLPPTEFNEEGHWENRTFLDINDRILERFGGSWDTPPLFSAGWQDLPDLDPLRTEATDFVDWTFAAGTQWGWKDPRTTLTIPFWRRVIPELRFVVCVRNPLDVAASLETRDAMPVEASLVLWQLYTELALTNTDPRERIIVHYDDFFHRFDDTMRSLLEFIGSPELQPGSERESALQLAVSAGLTHHRHTYEDVIADPHVPAPTRLLYEGLLYRPETVDRLFNDRPIDEPLQHIVPAIDRESRARERLQALSADLSRREQEIERQLEQLQDRDRSIQTLEDQVADLTVRLDRTMELLQSTEDAVTEMRAQSAESRHYAERLLGSLEEREQTIRETVTLHQEQLRELAERHENSMREMSARLAEWQDHWTRVQGTVAWSLVENLRRSRRLIFPERSRLEWLWFHALRREVPGRRGIDPAVASLPASGQGTQASEIQHAVGRSQLQSFLEGQRTLIFPSVEQPRVSIVMLTWNQAHNTFMALQSLLAYESSLQFELIVIDNASEDETSALLDRLEHVRILRNETNAGFGAACNQGAALARGDLICFLNNDTLSNPGWLDELVRILDTYPRCGAVGAKLVLSDGRLQEAGSIIWRDGSTRGYGRAMNPQAPEYCYVREVDYCSAACLLIRKTLFDTLGGFDGRYAPAYYEDVDLCMAVRQAGFSVIFAPKSVVTHLEHASSDRSAAIALQQRNRNVFVSKWRQALGNHALPNVRDELRARDSRKCKRVLVIDDRIPEARFGSGFPRTRALLEMLARLDYVVTYLPTADPTPVEPDTSELQQLGIEVLHSVLDVSDKLRERRGLYDVAIVSRPTNVPFLPVVRQWNPSARVIYDAEAVFTFRDALQAEIDGNPFTVEQINERISNELAPLVTADAVITVSERERAAIEQHFPGKPVHVWGHPTSVRLEGPSFAERRGALFVGYLASAPNNDALLQLLREIIPTVYGDVGCSLTVIGSDAQPEALIAGAAVPRAVSFGGFVGDLTGTYDASRIFVAPHRFAAGVPLKVIEAMANGLPCVISQLLADQLGVTDGLNALVAASNDEFAVKLAHLYSEEALWQDMQRNGFQFIRERYDPGHMEAQLREVIEAHPAPAGSAVRSAAVTSR